MSERAKIWGPAYWMFLHTTAATYPIHPNETVKRKYYDFIQNFPLFIPDEEMSVEFSYLLDNFPVSPYLGNRDSFIHWVIFIHNKINAKLEKKELSVEDAMRAIDKQYDVSAPFVEIQKFRFHRYHFFIALSVVFLFLIYIGVRRGGL